jgi:diguanylate cyclase (GGDEF)-like protein
MSVDLSPEEAFELKLLFLQELGAGVDRARIALGLLDANASDAAALVELRGFFHRIAGTADAVELPLLGRLASACEAMAELLAEGAVPPNRRSLQVFADGLAGVESVLGRNPGPTPASLSTLSSEPSALVSNSGPSKILVVDDDPFSARLIDSVLRAAGFVSSYCCEPETAFETIVAESPDLLILDVVMPQMDGFDLCRRVRSHPALQLTPVIFVTRRGDVEQRVRGLQVGGNDYIAKPFEPQELVARVRSHLQRLAELREMAVRDGLTRCYNNKYFKVRLDQEVVRARRYGTDLTLGMLDIDHFKRINDTFGHPAGDAVLAHLASILTASVRSTDVVARYGGEEFGFLLVEAAVAEAAIITNRLRERIARHRFELPLGPHGEPLALSCTVSIGIAQFQQGDSVSSLLARADTALYRAKTDGRNLVRIAEARPA